MGAKPMMESLECLALSRDMFFWSKLRVIFEEADAEQLLTRTANLLCKEGKRVKAWVGTHVHMSATDLWTWTLRRMWFCNGVSCGTEKVHVKCAASQQQPTFAAETD